MTIPVRFVENISIYRRREYTCRFFFYSNS